MFLVILELYENHCSRVVISTSTVGIILHWAMSIRTSYQYRLFFVNYFEFQDWKIMHTSIPLFFSKSITLLHSKCWMYIEVSNLFLSYAILNDLQLSRLHQLHTLAHSPSSVITKLVSNSSLINPQISYLHALLYWCLI